MFCKDTIEITLSHMDPVWAVNYKTFPQQKKAAGQERTKRTNAKVK